MAFNFRICQNDTTAALRELFQATPMRVPETSVQPLMVIAEKNGTTDKRGDLTHLLSGKARLNLEVQEGAVANVNLQKTRSMDWDFGVKLLEGFFQGFNLPSAAIGAKLENAREVSLSFQNVRRRWIDKNELGSSLRKRQLDLSHPSARIFLGEDPYQLLVVTDIIVSNGFAVNVTRKRDNGANIEIPAIQQIVSEANAKVKVSGGSADSIAFEGPDFLTFAFTCVKLELDQSTGDLAVGTTVVTRQAAKGAGLEEANVPQVVELDDDEFEPGLLEWD